MWAIRFGRHDIPDFHLVIGNHHTIDEKLYQLSLLSKGGLFENRVNGCTKGLNGAGDGA